MAMTDAGPRPVPEALGVVAVAAATVAAWWAWLGWDTEYDIDPVTQSASGPYQPWQVAGCVLSLAVIAAVGALALRPWTVAGAMTVSFTTAWSWQAASTDDSGLWPVGAVLVFVGMAAGTTLGAFVARNMWRRVRRPAGARGGP